MGQADTQRNPGALIRYHNIHPNAGDLLIIIWTTWLLALCMHA